MAKPTPKMIVDVFGDSMVYEIIHSLGVPLHETWDYSLWEYINFTRAAHARLLYDFFEGKRSKPDDVCCSDYSFDAIKGLLDQGTRDSLNQRLLHLSYRRNDVDPKDRAWDGRILGDLLDPVLRFMRHILDREEFVTPGSELLLFRGRGKLDGWKAIMGILESGRELVHSTWRDPEGMKRMYASGRQLPDGKPRFTKLEPRTDPPPFAPMLEKMRSQGGPEPGVRS